MHLVFSCIINKWKYAVHTRVWETPSMSPIEWYCPHIPNQCGAIFSNYFSLRALLQLVSWCKIRSSHAEKFFHLHCS
jgi:hypothetical protein